MSATSILLGLSLLMLIASLFVLAMIEASLLHVRRSAVAANAELADHQAARLLSLLDDLPTVMNTVLLAVLLCQVTAASIAGVLAQRWLGGAGVTIATVGVTVFLFIYGEAIPKTIAIADPVRYALIFSGASAALRTLLSPVVWVLVEVAKVQSPGMDQVDTVSAVSEGELLHLTDEAAAAGRIEDSDAELIQKSFTLGDLSVTDVMTPINQVVSVAGSTPIHAALKTAIEAGHRRIPVHTGDPNRLIGFVRLRDLAEACTTKVDRSVTRQICSAIVTQPSALAIDLLRDMQRSSRLLAIVTASNGDAVGIVTVEDIVEEVLGEIDEPDPSEQMLGGRDHR